MSMWLALGWLAAASIFIRWIYSQTTPEPPPGVTIQHINKWHYIIEDPRAMRSGDYLTRASAIRAAQQELDRLHEKDQQIS